MTATRPDEMRAVAEAERPSLDSLAAKANAEHQSAMRTAREGAEHARAAGEALLTAKARVKHGEWSPWLSQNVKFSHRTATDYMEVARRWPEIQKQNGSGAAILTLRDALWLLATGDSKEHAPDEAAVRRALREKWVTREPLMVRRTRVLFESLRRQRPWERLDLDVPGLSEVTLIQIREMAPLLVEWLNLLGEAARAELARRPELTYGKVELGRKPRLISFGKVGEVRAVGAGDVEATAP